MSKVWIQIPLSLILCWSSAAAMQETAQPALKAREIFYRASPKAAPSTPAPATPAPRPTPPPPEKTNPVPPPATPAPEVRSGTSRPASPASTAQVQTVVYTPLGMRYSLMRRSGPGQYNEVDPETVFRSGDGLRVSVESNDSAFLYIVARGTSGAWNVLFPNASINKGDNRIEPHRRYETPSGGQFTFDQQQGTERVFVVLSRTQESDLESLIYSLDRTSAPQRPSSAPLRSIAQNIPTIPDELVGKIRDQFASRDLVFEKVDDTTSDRKEKAIYVINAKGAADSRVVVDLSLKHQ